MNHSELAARFKSPDAPRVLAIGDPDTFGVHFDGSWEAALVYMRAVARGLVGFWRERSEAYGASLDELQPMWDAVAAWFDGERSLEASREATAWAKSSWAWAELIEGRLEGQDPHEGRALGHLVHAVGCLVRACTPPTWEGVLPKRAAAHRMDCLRGARFEATEAIKGICYTLHPDAQAQTEWPPAFAEAVDAAFADYEARGAQALVAWLEAAAD